MRPFVLYRKSVACDSLLFSASLRKVVEKKLEQMLARNPPRMDYYKKYSEVLILDSLFAALPTPPFTAEEKEPAARRVYHHVWQQSASGHFAANRA